MSADLNGRPQRTDIVNAYRLALGRDPEAVAVVEDKLDHRNADWLSAVFKSAEFHDKVYDKALRAERLAGGYFTAPPAPELTGWAADFIPLSPPGCGRVRSSTDWYGLFHSLFEDEVFNRLVLDEAPRPSGDPLLAGLKAAALASIEGEVEIVGAEGIGGWAVDLRNPDRVLELELYADGVFVTAGSTSILRRDIQDRHGGQGRSGFLIRLPHDERVRKALFGEVLEAASKVRIGSFQMPAAHAPALDEVAMIRRELSSLRTLLDRIESRLPGFHTAFGFSLENYDAYFDTYYAPVEAQSAQAQGVLDLAVILDGAGLPMSALNAALDSVERQRLYPRELVIVCAGGDARLEAERLIAHWRQRLGTGMSVTGVPVEAEGWAAAMNTAVERTTAPQLIFFPADASLAPEATAAVASALEAGAALVYADSDEVEPAEGLRKPRHLNPAFRTAFDRDLLLQQDCLGELIGIPRERMSALGFRPEFEASRFYDLALRASEDAEARPRIVQIPQVLLHHRRAEASSTRRPQPDALLQALRDHLARTDPGASAEPHKDALGADAHRALRVRRSLGQGVKAAIVIPTRDRLDLLGPCLASLAAAALKTTVRTEILIVDNQSTSAETRAFLQTYSQRDDLRVIEHDGAFNWALINNRAAEQTDADVLIFLNNDTVVLTPDWCDELCVNALRPDVGAVGARLLYEDGTVQHAGVVMSEWQGVNVHEGMGVPGSDPGYLGRHVLLREVSTVTGACLATRASLFRQLGGFDWLTFPVEGNDPDYCLRLRSNGYRILYDPYATLYHFESKSRGYNFDESKRRSAEAAGQAIRERWGARFGHDPFYNPHFDRLSPPLTRLQAPPFLRGPRA